MSWMQRQKIAFGEGFEQDLLRYVRASGLETALKGLKGRGRDCDCTDDDDSGIGIFAARAANGLAGLALSLGRHSAGIEDDRVVQAGARGLITNNLGFPDIQPAAECLDTRRVTA